MTTISPEFQTAVTLIQYIDQMKRVGFAGIAHLHVAGQFVPAIHTDRQLVAEVRFAMFLRPARLDILLPALGRFPLDRRCSLLDDFLFFSRVVLGWRADDAGIDDLPFARLKAVQLKLGPHFIED